MSLSNPSPGRPQGSPVQYTMNRFANGFGFGLIGFLGMRRCVKFSIHSFWVCFFGENIKYGADSAHFERHFVDELMDSGLRDA